MAHLQKLGDTLIYTFFHRVKEPKRPARAKISHNSLLLTSRKRHPSFGFSAKAHSFVKLKLQSSQTLLARNGASNNYSSKYRGKRTRFSRSNSNRICIAQTTFALSPLFGRLFAVFLIVPVFLLELPMLVKTRPTSH